MPPRLARLVAVLAAIALVAGAFVLRGALAGDDESASSGVGSGSDGPDRPEGAVRVICDEDLGDAACEAVAELEGVDSMAMMTADEAVDAMSDPEVPYDAWLTLDPWPQILDVDRREVGLPPVADDGDPVPVASSTPAILTAADDGTACATPVEWSCLATEVAGGADIGLPTLQSAAGVLFLAAAAAGLQGAAEFGIDEVRTSPVADQLDELLDSARPGTLAEQNSRATLPGQFTALATTDGLARNTADKPQGRDLDLTVLELEPSPTTLGVVLAPIGPHGADAADRLTDQVTDQTVTEALATAGWKGGPARTEGLPAPDLLYALDQEFTQ